MKMPFFILLFFISYIGLAQNNYIVKTDDGRRVLLKADYTWEYIDLVKPTATAESAVVNAPKPVKVNTCNLPQDFVEPKLDKKIQLQLKKTRATISHIKKKVAKDYNCTIDEVLLLSASEKKERGTYEFCVNGSKVSYKRNGSTIIKSGKLF